MEVVRETTGDIEKVDMEIRSIYGLLEQIDSESTERFGQWLTFVAAYSLAKHVKSNELKRTRFEVAESHLGPAEKELSGCGIDREKFSKLKPALQELIRDLKSDDATDGKEKSDHSTFRK